MSPLSILHVDTEPVWRGGQAQVRALLGGLAARGHRQVHAAPDGPRAASARALDLPTAAFAPRSDVDLIAALALTGLARRARPDVVHAHTARAHGMGVLAAKLSGAACVVSRRVLFGPAGRNGRSLKYRLPVDRYLCVSHAIQDGLARAGVPERRLRVVRDGVEVSGTEESVRAARADGRSAALRAGWGADPGGALVGILAALTREKDHATFLEAARMVRQRRPAVRFVASGEGPLRADLLARAQAAGAGGTVEFPGFVEDLPAFLGALDVLVLCSVFEGLGTSLLLAQAASIPVVATRVGGIVEAVEDGVTGLLVPARDPYALAGAILSTLEDAAAQGRRVDAARRTVEAFDMPRMIEHTEAAYRDLLAERAGARREDPRR